MSMSMSKKALGTAYTSEEQEEMRLIRVEAEALKVASSTKQIKTGLVLSPALKLYTGVVYTVATNFVVHLVEGKRHRDNGPCMSGTGSKSLDNMYSLYGEEITFKVFELHYMLKYRKVYVTS